MPANRSSAVVKRSESRGYFYQGDVNVTVYVFYGVLNKQAVCLP